MKISNGDLVSKQPHLPYRRQGKLEAKGLLSPSSGVWIRNMQKCKQAPETGVGSVTTGSGWKGQLNQDIPL